MKSDILIIITIIILISGCLYSPPPTPKTAPEKSVQGTQNTAIQATNVTPTPTIPEPTPIPDAYFSVGIQSIPSDFPNLTVIVEMPKTQGNGTVTLVCNNSRFVNGYPNDTEESYYFYIYNDVTCREHVMGSIVFGEYNVSIGLPFVGTRYSVNVTAKKK